MSEDKDLTSEQIAYLQAELEMNFGDDLKRLEAMLEKDMMGLGFVSPETIKARDKLFKRILKEKHENDNQDSQH